jgi:hypothetical protein
MTRVLWACFTGWLAWCQLARAQAPDPGRDLELIESTERGEDPLGIDDSTRDLTRAAAALRAPKQVLPTASRGAALSAIDGVREQQHALHITLEHGLALVTVRMTFVSNAKHAAEIAYRLPFAGVLTGVQAEGLYRARAIQDERGRALSLQLAPIAAGGTAQLVVSYTAAAPVHGGVARFALPGRGYDPNLAPTTLSVDSRTLVELTPGGTFDPWLPLEVTGRLQKRDVAPGYLAEPFVAAPPRATWLFIDSSPSMEGPARNRLPPTLAALLTVLPEQTELHAFAFAARSAELGRFRAGEAPLARLTDAASLELGAASKPSAFARAVPTSGQRVVVLSDGIFDATPEEQRALSALRARGAQTWLLQLGDVPARLAGSFTHVLDVSSEAEAALHGGELSALEDRLRVIAARGGSGEEHVTRKPGKELAIERRMPVQALAAMSYESVPPAPAPDYTGMPRESVLAMLRTQLVPQARACLRSDRRGRADYAVALTFHAVFAEREVYEPRITGSIPRPLQECLSGLLPRLRVPAFTGRIRVHYPIFTEREAVQPALELEPALSQKLERAFGASPALP